MRALGRTVTGGGGGGVGTANEGGSRGRVGAWPCLAELDVGVALADVLHVLGGARVVAVQRKRPDHTNLAKRELPVVLLHTRERNKNKPRNNIQNARRSGWGVALARLAGADHHHGQAPKPRVRVIMLL